MATLALSIVIPAFDEAARIGDTLDATRVYLDRRGLTKAEQVEVLVVDDGSRDATPAVVERRAERDGRVRLARLPRNRGKGAAVREGVLRARGERVLYMDADLATPIEELERLERALEDGADVAIGSRALPQSDILVRQHPLREAMGKGFNLLVRGLLPGSLARLRDTQCGFKLYTRAAAQAVFPRARIDRYAFDVELLLLADRLGYRIAEVPIAWRHVEQSKVSPLRDASRMAWDLLRLRLQPALHREGARK